MKKNNKVVNRCNPISYYLVKQGQLVHCFRCIGCGVGGRWFKSKEGHDRALADHLAVVQK